MYPSKRDKSYACAVRKKAYQALYYEMNKEKILKQRTDRYDSDYVYRLGKLLVDSARERAKSQERRKRQLREES